MRNPVVQNRKFYLTAVFTIAISTFLGLSQRALAWFECQGLSCGTHTLGSTASINYDTIRNDPTACNEQTLYRKNEMPLRIAACGDRGLVVLYDENGILSDYQHPFEIQKQRHLSELQARHLNISHRIAFDPAFGVAIGPTYTFVALGRDGVAAFKSEDLLFAGAALKYQLIRFKDVDYVTDVAVLTDSNGQETSLFIADPLGISIYPVNRSWLDEVPVASQIYQGSRLEGLENQADQIVPIHREKTREQKTSSGRFPLSSLGRITLVDQRNPQYPETSDYVYLAYAAPNNHLGIMNVSASSFGMQYELVTPMQASVKQGQRQFVTSRYVQTYRGYDRHYFSPSPNYRNVVQYRDDQNETIVGISTTEFDDTVVLTTMRMDRSSLPIYRNNDRNRYVGAVDNLMRTTGLLTQTTATKAKLSDSLNVQMNFSNAQSRQRYKMGVTYYSRITRVLTPNSRYAPLFPNIAVPAMRSYDRMRNNYYNNDGTYGDDMLDANGNWVSGRYRNYNNSDDSYDDGNGSYWVDEYGQRHYRRQQFRSWPITENRYPAVQAR